MPAFVDLTGEHFGNRLVVRLDHFNQHRQSHWFTVCEECGTQRVIASQHLRSGQTRPCKHPALKRGRQPFQKRIPHVENDPVQAVKAIAEGGMA